MQPWSLLNLGSNTIVNPSGVLVVDGEEQINLERGDEDHQLLLTIDVFNGDGDHVAKLRRNAWAFNEDARYEITTHPSNLSLVERESGSVVLAASVVDRDTIEVLDGSFFTRTGTPVAISDDGLQLGGVTLARNHFDCGGRALRIDGPMFGIG